MTDSLFDPQDDTDYLTELTKPGAKFDRTKYTSDLEMYQAIAKGKFHGDKTLELQLQKNDELREDFLRVKGDSITTAKLEELLTRLEAKPPVDTDTGPKEQPFDMNKINDLILQRTQETIKSIETKRVEDNNLAVVESRLRDRFGDSAKQILRDKMQELGLSTDDLKFLAKKSPEAVINALGVNIQPQGHQAPPASSFRSDNFHKPTEIRDAVYYEKLRKEQPKEYFSDKTSVQRLKDMEHPDFMKRSEERLRAQYFTQT